MPRRRARHRALTASRSCRPCRGRRPRAGTMRRAGVVRRPGAQPRAAAICSVPCWRAARSPCATSSIAWRDMGLAGPEIRVVGGGARSPLWLQMKADVTGRTVRVLATDQATAMGAAMLAAVGAGFVARPGRGGRALRRPRRAGVRTGPSRPAAYDDAYGRYRRLFDAMEPTFVVTTRSTLPDPTDLDGLRARLDASGGAGDDGTGRAARRPIGMGSVRIDGDALDGLVAAVDAVRREGPVLVVVDGTPMRRAGADLKATAIAALEARFDTRVAVIEPPWRRGPRRCSMPLARPTTAIAAANPGCVVSIGSGTITDVAKDASLRAGGIPFVVVQTAVSVNAFSDDMAVLLRDGVKRTVPSRWPDALLVDLQVIADAPPAMNRAGFGELCSMFTAPADWYLANAVGLDDTYDEAVVGPVPRWRRGPAGRRRARPGQRPGDARRAGLADDPDRHRHGRGRPDRAAVRHRAPAQPPARHGGRRRRPTAGVPWRTGRGRVRAGRDALAGDARAVRPGEPGRRARARPTRRRSSVRVRAAFDPIDPSGRMADECWRDVAKKLERWRAARPRIEAFAEAWPRHRAALRPARGATRGPARRPAPGRGGRRPSPSWSHRPRSRSGAGRCGPCP